MYHTRIPWHSHALWRRETRTPFFYIYCYMLLQTMQRLHIQHTCYTLLYNMCIHVDVHIIYIYIYMNTLNICLRTPSCMHPYVPACMHIHTHIYRSDICMHTFVFVTALRIFETRLGQPRWQARMEALKTTTSTSTLRLLLQSKKRIALLKGSF